MSEPLLGESIAQDEQRVIRPCVSSGDFWINPYRSGVAQFEVMQSASITARTASSAKPNARSINIALMATSSFTRRSVSSRISCFDMSRFLCISFPRNGLHFLPTIVLRGTLRISARPLHVHFSNRLIEVTRFQTYDLDAVQSAESLERRRRLVQAKGRQTTRRTFPTRSAMLSGI